MRITLRSGALVAASAGLFATSVLALAGGGNIFFEVEPNNDKSQANFVPIFGANGYTGIFGLSNPSGLDRDYFELEAAPIPFPVPMPWRYSMDVSFLANPAFLRGLDQTPAGIVLGSDSPVQISSLDPASFVSHLQWYGFGKGHRLYWDAGNLDFSRVIYEADLSFIMDQVTDVGVPLAAGQIEITTVGQGHVTDTDLWVYDAWFNALPGYGNDDDPALLTTRSTLVRRYAPGRYYLAITDGNLANDERSPADELVPTEPVLDFPDVVLSSGLAPYADLSFEISDEFGTAVPVSATKSQPQQVLWFAFDVGSGQAIQPFCGGTGCPCGNDSVPLRGDGCVNSTGRGGLLYASGTTSVVADDLAYHALGLPPGAVSVLFSGSQSIAALPFGDGLRCVGGQVRRLGMQVADGQGKATWTGVGALAGFAPGDRGYFQVQYRDTQGPCGAGFGATNALQVGFLP